VTVLREKYGALPRAHKITEETALFDQALDKLNDQGGSTPCQGQWALWDNSEDQDDRQAAIALCRKCPLVDLCLKAARSRREQHLVWGARYLGKDYKITKAA
jgi:hypothetical protein